MVEKIYDKYADIQTVNQMAAKLRQLGLKDELKKLCEFYRIPASNGEAFLSGKRYFLIDGGDTEKEYLTVRSKLLDEMTVLKDPMFADVIGNYLLKQYKEKPELEKQILQKHKTLQRCVESLMEKAWNMIDDARKQERINSGLAVRDDTVFLWVLEYYAEDDLEKIKEARETAEKEFAKKVNTPDTVKKAGAASSDSKRKKGKKGNAAGMQHQDSKPAGMEEGEQLSLFDTNMNA